MWGPDLAQLGARAGLADVDRLAHQLLAALRHEQPGQVVLAGCAVPLQGPELVAGHRLLGRQRALEAGHVEPAALEIEGIPAQVHELADAQPVPVQHQQQGVVADPVAAFLGCLEEELDLLGQQEVTHALVAVGRVDGQRGGVDDGGFDPPVTQLLTYALGRSRTSGAAAMPSAPATLARAGGAWPSWHRTL
jgi:hypothetical protein